MKKKVLVVAAHPDDETIWMGGSLLKNIGKWDLTIVCLCRKNDKDRAPKFRKVCKFLGAKKFYMSDLEDENLNYIGEEEVVKRIKRFANKEYDYVFTHGKNGEYGHPRHVLTYFGVVEMIKTSLIKSKKLFLFSYVSKGQYCYTNKNADMFIKLNRTLLNTKKSIVQDIYGFDKKSFESICCRGVESFKEK